MKRCIIRSIALMTVLLLTVSGLALAEEIEMNGPEEYVGEQELFLGDQTDEKQPNLADENQQNQTDEDEAGRTDEKQLNKMDEEQHRLTDEEQPGQTDEEQPGQTDEKQLGQMDKEQSVQTDEEQPGQTDDEQSDQTDEVGKADKVDKADEDDQTNEEQSGLVLNGILDGLVYNGEPQPLVIAEEGMLYSLDGENFSTEAPTGIDAGEYIIYIKPVDGGEVTTISVTIEKADVVFTPPTAIM